MDCAFCPNKIEAGDESELFREVRSWVHGPKLDGPVLREQTGRVAHKACVEKLMDGQAPDQETLL